MLSDPKISLLMSTFNKTSESQFCVICVGGLESTVFRKMIFTEHNSITFLWHHQDKYNTTFTAVDLDLPWSVIFAHIKLQHNVPFKHEFSITVDVNMNLRPFIAPAMSFHLPDLSSFIFQHLCQLVILYFSEPLNHFYLKKADTDHTWFQSGERILPWI